MQRLGAPSNYMDAARRQDILLQIAGTRAKEKRILEVINTMPGWVDRPFQADQENFNANLKTYQDAEPIVRNLESRLTIEPGPVWRELTQDEMLALTNWTKAVDQLYAYVNTYFPSESQQYIAQAALVAIAIGAFIAPIFLDEPEKGLSLPFGFEPPKFPSSPKPVVRPELPPSTPSQRIFTPSSFSRIPGATGPSSPIRVQAEVMRPAASTPTPWRRIEAATPPTGATPGFRTFSRPLGPETPVARVQTPTEAAATVMRSGPAAESVPPAPHGPPRFRRA